MITEIADGDPPAVDISDANRAAIAYQATTGPADADGDPSALARISSRAARAVTAAGNAGVPGWEALDGWLRRVAGAVGDWSEIDCVPLAWGVFRSMHGRSGNAGISDDWIDTWTIEELGRLLAVESHWTAVDDLAPVAAAMTERPGSMLLVWARPPGQPAHVYWMVSDPTTGALSWIDPQDITVLGQPVITEPSPTSHHTNLFYAPGTRVALCSHDSRRNCAPPSTSITPRTTHGTSTSEGRF